MITLLTITKTTFINRKKCQAYRLGPDSMSSSNPISLRLPKNPGPELAAGRSGFRTPSISSSSTRRILSLSNDSLELLDFFSGKREGFKSAPVSWSTSRILRPVRVPVNEITFTQTF
ncbi:unnamed protein product [Schistosoma mattheei]|uniref:Uncharacterized protein n=1 Tax=Schistosoma mattheei TaxID=31246 RepID=A0A3P8BNG3_9TREM|nr:unnamed protein product [Schistosoma mattheei]